ncbi:MAG: TolC family protein [Planctomycetes bacterium]|nr:TolC family protein [Planctomycetota bacterium]
MKSALALLLAAGCTVAPPREAIPWLHEPYPSSMLPEATANDQKVEGRHLIDLATVLRLAGANSLDVAFVREKLDEAYSLSQIAVERFWPGFGPELALRRHEGLTQATEGQFVDVNKQQTFAGGRAHLRWEFGDALFAALSAAQRYEGGKAALEAAVQGVTLEAALAYFDLLRNVALVQVAEQSVQINERLAAELEASVQAGQGFKGDVLRARVRVTGSRLEADRAREAIRLASIRLGSLLRLEPGIELVPAESLPLPLHLIATEQAEREVVATALLRHPAIQAATNAVNAAEYDESAATWGALIPDVEADAAIGGLGPVLSRTRTAEDYAIWMSWNIGPGGLLDLGRQRLARSQRRQAQIQLERVRQDITDEVLASFAQLRGKERQMRLAMQAVEDGSESLALNQERRARNIESPLEVIEAEEALTRARRDYFISVVEHNQAQFRLYAATGRNPGQGGSE